MIGLNTFDIPGRIQASGHGHGRATLMVVSDGDMEENCGAEVRSLGAGGVRLSEPGVVHELLFGSEGARCTLIDCAGPFWSRIFARALCGRANLFASIDQNDAHVLAQADTRRLLRSESLLSALGRALATLEQGERPEAPGWFEDARDALNRGSEHRVSHIAALLRRDRTHFARAFAAYSGFRPVEYRALRRLASALDLISSDAPLAEVALAAGYAHQSHMTNAFRHLLGASPTQLRGA